jgi:hypothetical protein
MPVKLPAPEAGTEAQPGPKSVVVAPELLAGADDAGAEAEPAALELEDPLELHAAAPRAQVTVSPATARNLRFMILFSLGNLSGLRGFGRWRVVSGFR